MVIMTAGLACSATSPCLCRFVRLKWQLQPSAAAVELEELQSFGPGLLDMVTVVKAGQWTEVDTISP